MPASLHTYLSSIVGDCTAIIVSLTMEEQDTRHLGNFAKLPPEIRLLIWERLFALCRFHAYWPSRDRSEAKNLSILYANRTLYREVEHHLYSSLTHTMGLGYYCGRPTIAIYIASKWLSVRWQLDDKADCLRHFQNFPHRKAPPALMIPASPERGEGAKSCLGTVYEP
jgi:hypothetical protein